MGSIVDQLRKSKDSRNNSTLHFEDTTAAELYPELSELLFRAKVGKDKRRSGSFRIFVDGGVLKCCFTAPSEGQVGFVTLGEFEGLLERLEGLLADGKVDWREDTFTRGRGR